MSNENEIIELLKEQNKYLKFLVNQKIQDNRWQMIKTGLHIFANLLPFIILFILGYYVYSIIIDYLNALNSNVDALKEGYIGLQDLISGYLEGINEITDSIDSVWQDTRAIFN